MKTSTTTVLCLLVGLATNASADAPASQAAMLSPAAASCPGERLSLGVENTGVYLDRIFPTYPEEYEWIQAIRLTNKGHITRLQSLQDLKGLVHIRNCKDALVYARLRTAPNTWNLIGGEMEIVTRRQAAQLPTFGLKGNSVSMDPKSNSSPTGFSPVPGLGGVIPSKVYRYGGFAPAHVKVISGGFSITRWVFSDVPVGTDVEKIREIVTPAGNYHRTMLLRKKVGLRGVELRLPYYGGE
jgi:hypothetical protein